MLAILSALAVLSAVAGTQAQDSSSGLVQKKYEYLPLGAIKPVGWLYDQVMVQTNGLAGNEMNFYDYVNDTDWLNGTSYYSDLEEAGSYWFNGIVPNSIIIDSPELQEQTRSFMNFVFDHQDESGWIGPEVFDLSKPRYLWGRYLFLFGIIQLIEYDPSIAESAIPKIWKFVELAHTMVKNNEGLDTWGQTRWGDFVMSLEWLYEHYPNDNQEMLLDLMSMLKANGTKWDEVLSESMFPTVAVENLPNPFNNPLVWHGVNMAEGLKSGAAAYRYTHNQTLLDLMSSGWDLLFKYHGRPSGIFAADEHLAGLQAVRGTELCVVVETMFTGSYLFQVSGDTKFVDRAERMAYNALPAQLTGTMWSRQYLQQQNQVGARNMTPNPFPTDGPYSNVFGLEPNYPCCTVNHPQGYPKFVTNAFVTTPDKSSLVHVYLGPFSMQTTLANNNNVKVSVDTMYPFADTLTTTINADHAFTYYVRVPGWAPNATIAVNGRSPQTVQPQNGLQSIQVGAGTTTLVMDVTPEITFEQRPENSIAVHRGPLHYAFDISRNQTLLKQNAMQPLAVDLQFLYTDTWQYAIDPDTITFHYDAPADGTLPSPIYDHALPPMSMTVTACQIAWGLGGETFADSPPENTTCAGSPMNITLWPYGSTKLRIGEFPTFKVSG